MAVTILSAKQFSSNAEIVEACFKLGFIRNEDAILDTTYAKGVWWKWPFLGHGLVTNDLNPKFDTTTHFDVRRLPMAWNNRFKVTAFDPPYVSIGGRKTTKLADFYDQYGLLEAMKTPESLHSGLIVPGISACVRVTQPGGIILQKTTDYVSSGKLVPAAHWAYEVGTFLGLKLIEEFIYVVPKPRPQPTRRGKKKKIVKQQHARHNFSIMYVWRKVK